MKPEAQRIAIAEACGWTGPYKKEWLYEEGPNGEDSWQYCGTDPTVCRAPLPDYLADLNAMHDAESALKPAQWNAYVNALDAVVAGDDMDRVQPMTDFRFCTAAAAQRAEAFLRTIGKWEDA